MPAMTMPWKVQTANMLDNIGPGDLITSEIVVDDNQGVVTKITKLGTAKPDVPAPAAPAKPGVKYLMPGDAVPNQAFVDQDGRDARLQRRFAAIARWPSRSSTRSARSRRSARRWIASSPKRRRSSRRRGSSGKAALLSVSFDPKNDTPPVLKQHAQKLESDPKRVDVRHRRSRGDRSLRDEPAADARARRGRRTRTRSATRCARPSSIASGRIAKSYSGADWTPAELVAELRTAALRAHGPAMQLHASRAAAHRAAAHAARRPALPERASLQHRAAARARDAAQFSRRRPASHGALPRSGAVRGDGARAARLSAARHQLRIDRRAGSRDLRVSEQSGAFPRPAKSSRAVSWGSVARSRDPGLHGRKPVFATPRALAASYLDTYVDLTGRIKAFALVDLRVMGDYDWRLSETERVEGRAHAARHEAPAAADARRAVPRFPAAVSRVQGAASRPQAAVLRRARRNGRRFRSEFLVR